MKTYLTPKVYIAMLFLSTVLFGCKKDEDNDNENPPQEEENVVNMNLDELPYEKLSDYNFFQGDMRNLDPQEGVLPYELISSLFTDYAKKSRFVWMPEGASASYDTDHTILNFPDGAVTIKNFYYDNVLPEDVTRIIETRIMYKKDGAWEFAEYVWNNEQTEAYYDMSGSFTDIEWLDEEGEQRSAEYRIPSDQQCFTCHKIDESPSLIGPKPQNLNKDMAYEDGMQNQLAKWVEQGYLVNDYPDDIVTLVDWKDEGEDISLRARSYIDINCAHCHQAESHCSYRSMRFAFSESEVDENMGICVEPDENIDPQLVYIINKNNINKSVVYYRLNTTQQNIRMPLLGRTIIHEEALEMIEDYINSFDEPCL